MVVGLWEDSTRGGHDELMARGVKRGPQANRPQSVQVEGRSQRAGARRQRGWLPNTPAVAPLSTRQCSM